MSAVKRSPPPPMCWSCGRAIPEDEYDKFHEKCVSNPSHQKVLDDMGYPLLCCRRMFLGDDPEYRRIMALYDMATINDTPHL